MAVLEIIRNDRMAVLEIIRKYVISSSNIAEMGVKQTVNWNTISKFNNSIIRKMEFEFVGHYNDLTRYDPNEPNSKPFNVCWKQGVKIFNKTHFALQS
jgi:hypothetical protein